MKNKIIVVFSSHLGGDKNVEFIKHIDNTIGCDHEIYCYTNYNQYSLSEVYNKAIKEHNQDNVIMVFCHPDITIRTPNWGRLLLTKFNNSDFSILGVAGSKYLADNGIWWTVRSDMRGVVEHTDGYTVWESIYSKPIKGYIEPVVVIDGVFMAVDCEKITCVFDEDFKGFHFYDLNLSFDNYLNGSNIGVTTDIRILHQSVGATNDEWEKNRLQFVEKNKNVLPIIYGE